MKGHQDTGVANEFAAEAYKLLGQGDGRDTAAAWAAVAAWASQSGPELPDIPAPGISPPGVPKPRLPGVGPLPGP